MIEKLLEHYIPEHYNLFLHVSAGENQVRGCVSITFKKNQYSDFLNLHTHPNINIISITQNKMQLNYNITNEKLIIQGIHTQNFDFSTYPIIIDYIVQPNLTQKIGLYMYNSNYFTQLEPNYARQLLPCFDEPCIRSTFSVTIQIPSNLTGISNMPIEKVTQIGEFEKKIVFEPTPPMCVYLLCVCVGTFSKIEGSTLNGLPVNFYGYTDDEEELLEHLQVTTFSVEWMEHYFNVRYELPQLQVLYCDGCPGGMENYGFITINKYPEQTFKQASRVIMHEVVHQWFGDLVEIKWWDSIWLNEGFAEFIQHLILNDYFPENDEVEFYSFHDGFRNFDYYFKDRKLVPLLNEINFENVLDSFVYVKGSFVLKMFYDIVGRDSFFEACSSYLNTFKNKNATVSDFVNSVCLRLNKDYWPFFKPWMYFPSFPVLIVNEIVYNQKNNKKVGVTISQTSNYNVNYQFKVPIVYELNGKINEMEVFMQDFMIEFNFEFDWIIVNNNFKSLCFVMYSKVLLKSLVAVNNEGKLNKVNKIVIGNSVASNSVPYLIDNEIRSLAQNICK